MAVVKVVFGLALLGAVASGSPAPPSNGSSSSRSELPGPSYARTMLKVSRSLPGETEELKVKTSEGSVATLIVKRRSKSEPAEAAASADATTTTTTPEPWRSWSGVADAWRPVERPSWAAEGSSRALADGQRILRYAFLPHEPARRTNVGANLDKNRDAKHVPAEVVVRSEISVKPQPKRLLTVDPDGTPVVHGRRVPDEPIDKVQVWRNARVINDQLVTDPTSPQPQPQPQAFDTFFEHVNRRYGKTSESSEPKQYRNEVLAAEIYESGEESSRPSIRKRMLQPELQAGSYPNSRLYSTAETVTGGVKVGTRAPVLQYAHPELGVQPAKVVKNERKDSASSSSSSSSSPSRSSHGEHRQKKKYVLNDKNLVDSYNYKNYYQNTHFYGLKKPTYEPPFWIKISENIKSGFSDGVAKVSELTKPVLDPLVEATRKISHNLGLSRSADGHQAQDKLGSVATGSSVLIPALGLMASGAALGIGAVAVGRYLDVDVLKRSNDRLELLDQRSRPDGLYVLVQPRPELSSPVEESPAHHRTKRSSEASRNSQRKGADHISDIVQIDLPSRSAPLDALDDSTNDLRLENEQQLAAEFVRKTLEAIDTKSWKFTNEQQQQQSTRRRRRIDEDEEDEELQKLEKVEPAEPGRVEGDWSTTPCAKRLFCDAMLKRTADQHMFMEKKMAGLLKMIEAGAAVQVSAHFDKVMEAVRRHDCSVFSCPQTRPAGVFF